MHPRPRSRSAIVPFEIDRSLYARMYGPTTGDRVRLGDTNLLVEVERAKASPVDEAPWGFVETIRSTRAYS
jgi:urease alpha subunit